MSADSGEPEFSEQERKALSQIAQERIEDWPTRRAALGTGAALLGGAGFVTGRASAHSANPTWGSASGQIGTESNPANRIYVADAHSQTVTTEGINTETLDYGYYVVTDGTDILARPQNVPNSNYPTLDETSGTDIGTFWETLVFDKLPPQGSKTEATGTLHFGLGLYPGDASNGAHDGLTVPAQLQVIGTIGSHKEATTNNTIPTQKPGTKFTTTGNGWRNPNQNTEFTIYPRIENVAIEGQDTSTGTGMDFSGSNTMDWAFFRNCVVQYFSRPFDVQGLGLVYFENCQIRKFGGNGYLSERCFFNDGAIVVDDGADIHVQDAQISGSELHSVGENTASFDIRGDAALVDNRIRKMGSGTTGTAVNATSGDPTVSLNHLKAPGGGSWDAALFVTSGSPQILFNRDFTGSNNTVNMGSSAVAPVVMNLPPNNGVAGFGNADRPMENWQGVESANAEEPSGSWPKGAIVDFTDSGDGTGTGKYVKLWDGSWHSL